MVGDDKLLVIGGIEPMNGVPAEALLIDLTNRSHRTFYLQVSKDIIIPDIRSFLVYLYMPACSSKYIIKF